jgi:hypothetical protein
VHDNLTVDRARVVALCDALTESGERFSWTCSSRADALDDELLERMRRAGCTGLFLGIESGSPEIQRSAGKRLDLRAVRERLRRVDARGIEASVAFIAGFPDETAEDLAGTVDLFVESLRLDRLEPQLALLAPLAGTRLHERHRRDLALDAIVSDVAFQGDAQERADLALIRRHPDVFPSFHSVPTPLDRRELHELRGFLAGARLELRWLLLAAASVSGGGLRAFRAFRAWRRRRARAASPRALAAYYRGRRFRKDFVRFARALASRSGAAGHALRELARYHASVEAAPRLARRTREPRTRPVRAAGVHLFRLGCDAAALVRALREGGDLAGVPRRESALATRVRSGRRELLHLGPGAADLLELCDGTRDGPAIARAFERLHPGAGGVPAEVACAAGIAALRRGALLAPFSGVKRSAARPAPPRASRAAPSSRRGAAGRRPPASSAPAGAPARRAPRPAGPGDRASAP